MQSRVTLEIEFGLVTVKNTRAIYKNIIAVLCDVLQIRSSREIVQDNGGRTNEGRMGRLKIVMDDGNARAKNRISKKSCVHTCFVHLCAIRRRVLVKGKIDIEHHHQFW